jgi:hypothetical protein
MQTKPRANIFINMIALLKIIKPLIYGSLTSRILLALIFSKTCTFPDGQIISIRSTISLLPRPKCILGSF